MTTYYLQVNLMCTILLIGVRTLFYGKIMAARRRTFNYLITATIITCITDISSWVCNGNPAPYAHVLSYISNSIYDLSITFTCFIWLIYVNIRLEEFSYNHRRYMFMAIIPVYIVAAVLLANPITGFMFSVDENNIYTRGSGIAIHWICSWGYLFYSLFLILRELRNTKDKIRREELIPLLLFIVFPAIGAIIQMLCYGTTTTQVGMTFSILMIVFSTINAQISADALTGLNNRRSMEIYLNNQVGTRAREFSVLFCDVNRFKQINDTFGHPIGDMALRDVANALKEACGDVKGNYFLCRYGGDEFVLIGADNTPESLDSLCESIHRHIDERNGTDNRRYHLAVSIGVAEGSCKSLADVDKLIHKADDAMYRHKNARE